MSHERDQQSDHGWRSGDDVWDPDSDVSGVMDIRWNVRTVVEGASETLVGVVPSAISGAGTE